MTVTSISTQSDLEVFASQVVEQAQLAFDVFRETNTITANGTVGFVERVPGEDKVVIVNYQGPFNRHQKLEAIVAGLDGTLHYGNGNGRAALRYAKIFEQFPEITTVSHVHSPYLGAWAQTHRTLPIRYVPVQRFNLIGELPVYVDRRQQEVDFIVDQIKLNPHHTAILEANGGATVWGRQGLRKLAEFIVLLEEGAQIQLLAEAIGGSRNYGPGVLAQQWKMSRLYEQAQAENLLPATDLPQAQ